jgi:hypothetical protein
MKFILTAFIVLLITEVNICRGQLIGGGQDVTYVGHATLSSKPKFYQLIDKVNATKYILDSTRIYIAAIDKTGKKLWKTDPWKDNNLEQYRVARPIIVSFTFQQYPGKSTPKVGKSKEVIWVVYNNTQFGIIDKATGKFTWFGQD